MNDLEIVLYLTDHVGQHTALHDVFHGDSIVRIVSLNPAQRTFTYTAAGSDRHLTLSFDAIVEFSFKANNSDPTLWK